MIYGKVGSRPTKRHEVSGHQAAITDDTLYSRRASLCLICQVLTSAANRNNDPNQIRNPLPPLPRVNGSIPQKRRDETQKTHNHDPDTHADVCAFVYRCDCLATDDRSHEGEASDRSCV